MNLSAMDSAAYAVMKDAMGSSVCDLVRTFLDYVPHQINKLDHAIIQQDCTAIFKAAHAIKSSCGSMGALGLARTAGQIELLGRSNSVEGIEQLYLTLQQQFTEVVDFLEHESALCSDTSDPQ